MIALPSLRYEKGESLADAMWDRAERRSWEAVGEADIQSECREVVALGFLVPGRSELVWSSLKNSSVTPWNSFDIDDAEMHRVVEEIIVTWGERTRAHVLWHSHYVHDGPGGTDISTFPDWLVGVGVVYHAPTGTSHAYDDSGIIVTTSRSNLHAR